MSEAAYCDLVGVLHRGRVLTVVAEGLRRQAFGGEALDITLSPPVKAALVGEIARISKADTYQHLGGNRFRLVVSSAGDASPVITSWANQTGNKVEAIDQYLPSFDDVFVELLDRLTPAPTGSADA